jgi:hypothetical protein
MGDRRDASSLSLKEVRMRSHHWLFLALATVATGCGPSVDQQSAAKVMTATFSGVGQAQTKFMPQAGQTSASFNGTVTNPNGTGSATVSGSATQNGSAWSLTFDETFSNWSDPALGVTVNGALHESASFTTMNPLTGTANVSGDVHSTGSVNADVGIDITATYNAGAFTLDGNVGGNTLHISG